MPEVWKPVTVPGFESVYEVSSFGRIRRTIARSLLSAEEATAIQEARKRGQTFQSIAEQFHLTKQGVMYICKRPQTSLRDTHQVLHPAITRGYLHVDLHYRGHHKIYRVASLVFTAFIGPIAPGMTINHKNGMTTDNRPCNLELLTPKANALHAWTHLGHTGHHEMRGSLNSAAKLVEADILDIRALHESGLSHATIARRYGVTRSAIKDVITRRTWRHVL
jgi:predicted DNA-binding protein YlxM (UPF0122 family)